MIWLVCTGNFYKDFVDKDEEKAVVVAGQKSELIKGLKKH